MKQEKKKIYNHLLEYQQRFGGYTAANEEAGSAALDRFEEKWGSKLLSQMLMERHILYLLFIFNKVICCSYFV